MTHCAVYSRVSSEDQAERGTIENQLEFARKYCDLHQITSVLWYKDDGVSGTIPLEQRPDGARLLADAKAGLFDVLLVYKLDRLGRSARIVLNAVHELEQHGVKIKSMTEPFDTGDASGRFLLTILAGVADLERSNILERMWHGANRAARDGRWLGGIVPFGYRVNDEGYLEVNDDKLPGHDLSEAEVVRMIYALIAEQKLSTIRVADYLNALGIPPSYAKDGRQVTKGKRKDNTSGQWLPGRVRNMVVNSTYMGIHEYGKRSAKKRETIKREVPAIVSPEIWKKAQAVLQDNLIEATRNAKRQYLLRGLIKCGICGLTYTGTAYSGPGGKPKAYYVCNGKMSYRGPQQGKCASKNLPAEWVEGMVWSDCVNFIENPGQALHQFSEGLSVRKTEKVGLVSERTLIEKALHEKDVEKQSILDLYRRKLITSADVEKQLEKITAERLALTQREKNLSSQIDQETTIAEQYDSAEAFLSSLRDKIAGDPPFEVRREVIKALVNEILVTTKAGPDGRPSAELQIRYVFSHDTPRTDMGSLLLLALLQLGTKEWRLHERL